MNDAFLQVLLILAYLAIGLISVTFPIYAISVNFLPLQKWENEKEREKRRGDLRAKITQTSAKLKGEAQDTEQVAQLREQLDKYEAEYEGTELRYQYLTAKGAVGIPVALLVFALLCAGGGITTFYSDSQDSQNAVVILGVVSAFFSTSAIFRLYKTISGVEYGALRPERTVEFEVGFGNDYEKTKRIELNKPTRICLNSKTRECDIEKLYIVSQFPSELGVESYSSPDIVISTGEYFTALRTTQDYLPKGLGTGVSITATPRKKGRFSMEVSVCGKGIYQNKHQLTIEVA